VRVLFDSRSGSSMLQVVTGYTVVRVLFITLETAKRLLLCVNKIQIAS
jgi:hypothetical protein